MASDTPHAPATADPEPDDVIRCPRCGYDQQGLITQWADTCPLSSTCVECGLVIDWRAVFNPDYNLPRWWIEHARGGAAVPRQVLGTLLRTFWPWSFWSQLRMTQPVRGRRLAGYLAALLLLVVAGFSVLHAWGASGEFATRVGGGAVPTTSRAAYVVHTLLLPFSDTSIGSFRMGGGTFGYHTPRQRMAVLWWYRPTFIVLLIGHAACGLTFAALPVSRRLARVRRRHLVRVGLYGAALTLAAFAALVAPLAALHRHSGLVLLGLVVFELTWWSLATGRYLRMPHAWAVGTAVVIVGALTAALLTLGIVSLSPTGPYGFPQIVYRSVVAP